MKNKIVDVVFKKFQSYSFIIFLALILGAFFALAQLNNQDKDKKPADDPIVNPQPNDPSDPSTPVNNQEKEEFLIPMNADIARIARNFWDLSLPEEEQLEAIVVVNDKYYMNNVGVDYTVDNEAAFDVKASLTGTVTKVRQDALVGNIVEVEHLYGIKTVYSSLETVYVAVGDKVDQGDVIGVAGENNFDKESGVHLHFEILHNGRYQNPTELIGTKIMEFKQE